MNSVHKAKSNQVLQNDDTPLHSLLPYPYREVLNQLKEITWFPNIYEVIVWVIFENRIVGFELYNIEHLTQKK